MEGKLAAGCITRLGSEPGGLTPEPAFLTHSPKLRLKLKDTCVGLMKKFIFTFFKRRLCPTAPGALHQLTDLCPQNPNLDVMELSSLRPFEGLTSKGPWRPRSLRFSESRSSPPALLSPLREEPGVSFCHLNLLQRKRFG